MRSQSQRPLKVTAASLALSMGREERERLWRGRLADAHLRLDFARHFLQEMEREFPLHDTSPDGQFAYQRALCAEKVAEAEWRRILHIFTDLVMEGKVPDESDWQRRRASE